MLNLEEMKIEHGEGKDDERDNYVDYFEHFVRFIARMPLDYEILEEIESINLHDLFLMDISPLYLPQLLKLLLFGRVLLQDLVDKIRDPTFLTELQNAP